MKDLFSAIVGLPHSQLQEIEKLTLLALIKCSYCLDDYTTHDELKDMLNHKKML
jgi:hypothetical protein